jgi:hypothetical protein
MPNWEDFRDLCIITLGEEEVKNIEKSVEIISGIIKLMDQLTSEERLEILRCYCQGCGDIQSEGKWCQCRNDE